MKRPLSWSLIICLLTLFTLAAACSGEKAQVKSDPPVTSEDGDEGDDKMDEASSVSSKSLEAMRAMRDAVEELDGLLATSKEGMEDADKERVLFLLETLEDRVGGLIEADMRTGHKNLDDSLKILHEQIIKAKEGANATPPSFTEATNVTATCLNCHASLGGL